MSKTRQASVEEKAAQIYPDKGRSQPLPGDMLHRIGNKFAHYIEPISKKLARHTANRTLK